MPQSCLNVIEVHTCEAATVLPSTAESVLDEANQALSEDVPHI
jgi:hypothetical protein